MCPPPPRFWLRGQWYVCAPTFLTPHFYFPLELYVYITLTNNYLAFFIYQLIILWTISINWHRWLLLNNHISKYNSFILVLYWRYINYVSVCPPHFLAPSYATVYLQTKSYSMLFYILTYICGDLMNHLFDSLLLLFSLRYMVREHILLYLCKHSIWFLFNKIINWWKFVLFVQFQGVLFDIPYIEFAELYWCFIPEWMFGLFTKCRFF